LTDHAAGLWAGTRPTPRFYGEVRDAWEGPERFVLNKAADNRCAASQAVSAGLR
jgi:hypothetical protein